MANELEQDFIQRQRERELLSFTRQEFNINLDIAVQEAISEIFARALKDLTKPSIAKNEESVAIITKKLSDLERFCVNNAREPINRLKTQTNIIFALPKRNVNTFDSLKSNADFTRVCEETLQARKRALVAATTSKLLQRKLELTREALKNPILAAADKVLTHVSSLQVSRLDPLLPIMEEIKNNDSIDESVFIEHCADANYTD